MRRRRVGGDPSVGLETFVPVVTRAEARISGGPDRQPETISVSVLGVSRKHDPDPAGWTEGSETHHGWVGSETSRYGLIGVPETCGRKTGLIEMTWERTLLPRRRRGRSGVWGQEQVPMCKQGKYVFGPR